MRAAALPGHEALVEQLAFDGKTTPAEAAMAVITAERQVTANAAKHMVIDTGSEITWKLCAEYINSLSDNAAASSTGRGAAAPSTSLRSPPPRR